MIARDHFIIPLAGSHHGVHAGVTVDEDLEKRGALEVDELRDHPLEFRLLVDSHREFEAVRLRRLDEILGVQALVAGAQASLVKKLLPLLDHTVAEIVEHHDFHRQIVGRDGFEFTDVHANARIAVDVDDQSIAPRHLRPYGRGQTESHRAHASGRQPQARAAKIKILRRPHLMLTDAGRDDGLAAGQLVDRLDHVVRLNQFAVAVEIHGVLGAQFTAVAVPRGPVALELFAPGVVQQFEQCLGHQTDVAPLHPLDLADLGSVDIDMRDKLCMRCEFRNIARHSVIEARAEGQQTIAIFDRVVGKGGAVHAQHAHRQRRGGIHSADTHERGHDGYLQPP